MSGIKIFDRKVPIRVSRLWLESLRARGRGEGSSWVKEAVKCLDFTWDCLRDGLGRLSGSSPFVSRQRDGVEKADRRGCKFGGNPPPGVRYGLARLVIARRRAKDYVP